MEDYICGECAQNNNLSIDERINIALSLKKGVGYTCKFCSAVKTIPLKQNIQAPTVIEENNDDDDEDQVESIEQILLF